MSTDGQDADDRGASNASSTVADPASLTAITAELREFAAERDWQQFHTPKNLAMGLAGEAGELLAEFQRLTPEQSAGLTAEQRRAVADEMADVLIYLCRLGDVTGIDLLAQRRPNSKPTVPDTPWKPREAMR